MSIEFLITSLVVVMLPGTGVLFTLAVGLGRGFKASVAAAIGCTAGIVPAALASVVGLSALLHSSSIVFQAIRYLGVIYLFYMAWKVLQDGGTLDVEANENEQSYSAIATNALLLNVLNPKLSLFFLAFLPQFVSPDSDNITLSLLVFALVFMLMTFVVFAGYGALASLATNYVISRPRVLLWIRRSFAGAFGVLGLKLAFTDR